MLALLQRNKQIAGSRPSALGASPSRSALSSSSASLHPKQSIKTPKQFYDWFVLVDLSVAHSQESHFHTHITNVSEHLDTCDALLETIEKDVDSILENWRNMEEGGRSLKDACERLLDERVCIIFHNVQRLADLFIRTSYWS
jgi:conserved oligomeric Golgi complex subunit 3